MHAGLPTASFRLCNLLASPFQFMTPAYQRPYSWTIKEAGQLLEDLMTAAGVGGAGEGEPDYFLSSIVLLSAGDPRDGAPKKPGARLFDIVDGQQRLITLTLLAAALRGFEPARGSKLRARLESMIFVNEMAASAGAPRVRVELRGRERTCYEHLTRVEPLSGDDYARQDLLHAGETNLLAVWDHFLAELSQLDDDERRRLSSFMCDNCHFVVIFTRDIDRAHRMFSVLNERGKKLQRNDILKAEVLRRVAPARAMEAALQWELAAGLLSGNFEQFFSHLRVLHGKHKPQVVAGVRAIIDEVGGAERFLDQELVPLASAYSKILRAANPSLAIDGDIRRSLIYLGRLGGQEWAPAALLAMRSYDKDPAGARVLMREIERFSHLLRILCLGNGKRVSRFNAVIEQIKSGAALEPGARVFRFSREEMKSLAYNLKDLHRRNTPICKLVLLRINDALSGTMADIDPANITVEHVLPQRPGANSEWRQWAPDPEERAACGECLGNFVLVSPRQNDRARNQDFARKQTIYAAPPEGVPVLAITREAVDAAAWTANDIRAREARFLKILADVWRLDIDAAGANARAA